ncbi:MAG TPA: carboxypeptidase regulatory-like domain-containing protein [Bryobacteraceae bacterium]|nr:carboxypeptidase regulatory-like domain-containing protein [Bryobacteraceae bacterium]
MKKLSLALRVVRRERLSQLQVCALITVLLIFTFLASPLFAQDATGRIVGFVTDPSGSVVPKAKVVATNVETGVNNETTTGDDGGFQIPLLPIGMYRISVEAPGFRKVVTEAQKLEINQSLRVDAKLDVGATTETVQVEANASGVETVAAALGNSVTGTQIAEAPLNGRNLMSLATLLPGVIPNSSFTTAGGTGFSVAGARPDSITFLLDGGMNTNLLNNGLVLNPNPDAVEEFRISTSNYSAEYGRNAGGIVSVVTKAGTNTFHGSAYEYVRNNDFNANSFFNNENGLPVSILKRNQFGAVVDGPVLIPKVFNGRNRFFFTMAYQGQRQTQVQTSSGIGTFTPAELTGDFSHSGPKGGPDPLVASFLQKYPFFQSNPSLAAQAIIDPSKIDPVAQKFIKAGLIPTSPTGTLFYTANALDNRDELTERLDFAVTDRDRLSVTLGSSRNPVLTPGNPGYPYSGNVHHYLGNFSYTKMISPSVLNEFRFTAQRNAGLQAVPASTLPTPAQLGMAITPDDPTGPPLLGFASGLTTGFSPQGPTALIDNTYTWSDGLTWNKGKHSMKFGFAYTPYQDNTVYDFYVNGEMFFDGTGGGIGSMNDRADFLFGMPDQYFQAPRAPSNIRTHNVSFYAQDEWKVRRNLTLSFGMRYEYSSPKQDLQGRSFSLLYGTQSTVFPNAPKGELFPGDAQAPRGSNFPDRNDWAPRFGFAWDPKGDGKTSIRGGVGVFYDILKAEDNLQFNGQVPFFAAATLFFNPLTGNPTGPLNILSTPYVAGGQVNPFPSQPVNHNINFAAAGFLPTGGSGVYFVNPNLRTPYVYQYNLSIQREIMRNTTIEVSYIGSDSHKLTSLFDSNPTALGTSTRIFNLQPGVAPGSFSYADTFGNVGGAHYNSMALGFSRRYTETPFGALAYQVSYTYGRSMDNVSGFRSTNSRVPTYNWNQFWGPSDFDLEHYVAISGSWNLPFDKWGGPKRLLGGWTLYPIATWRSGQVLNVKSGISRTATKTGPSGYGDPELVQANLVSALSFFDPHGYQTLVNASGANRTGNFYFSPASLAPVPAAFTGVTNYGSLGRNSFRGPGLGNLDVTMAKDITIKERARFELRFDFFNVMNHTEFGNPSTSITSSLFGRITTTSDPRIIQLAGRFSF